MANINTSIEWADATWSPVTGCTKVSPGCKHCYAERVFPRTVSGRCACGHKLEEHDHNIEPQLPCNHEKCFCEEFHQRYFTDVMCHDDRLGQPLRWRKSRRIFVNSMSDLFHEDVPYDFIDRVFAVMAQCPQHTFQILTKRPERMLEYLSACDTYGGSRVQSQVSGAIRVAPIQWPLSNVWLLVSAEDQDSANKRIPLLLRTPAAGHGVSLEPLLAAVILQSVPMPDGDELGSTLFSHGAGAGIDWVIVGGESGPKARPCNVEWIRSVVEQCEMAKVSVFVKQLGAHAILDARYDRSMPGATRRLHDRKGGDPAEWPEDLRIREFPKMRLL